MALRAGVCLCVSEAVTLSGLEKQRRARIRFIRKILEIGKTHEKGIHCLILVRMRNILYSCGLRHRMSQSNAESRIGNVILIIFFGPSASEQKYRIQHDWNQRV